MSGSTIGGVVGAVVGAYFGNPQLGWMIGSAIGGYVDPEQISGPRLQDARTQTSRDGIAIPFGWGTFPLAGNVIAQGPVVEVKKKERQGKGGPEVTTYTYTRTYAIGLCEGPITGILQVKRNGKVVYDARTDDAIAEEVNYDGSWAGEAINRYVSQVRAANAKWSNKATFYLGDETQMPDQALEAIFGAGNVTAHRGLAYFVVEDDDVTDLAGAIPQYEVVVAGSGTASLAAPTIGTQTHSVDLDTDTSSPLYFDAPQYIDSDGGALWISYCNPYVGTAPGNVAYFGGFYNSDFSVITAESTNYLGTSPGTDDRLWPIATRYDGWCVGTAHNDGFCGLYFGGEFVADLRPTLLSPMDWWASEATYSPEFGGLIWFNQNSVYVGVRKTGITPGVTINRIYKWPLADAGGGIVPASSTSPVVTAGVFFYTNVDKLGTVRAIALDEAELVTYNDDLTEASRVALPMPLLGLDAFAVDSGLLFLWLADSDVFVYELDTFELVQTIAVTGSFASQNYRMVFTHDSLFLQSGRHIKRVDYDPTCISSVPIGWSVIPDAPDAAVSPMGEARQLCSAVVDSIATDKVPLSTIVASVCERRGITASEFEVSQLTDLVTGFVVGRETDAASIIQSLAPAYFFDPGEWDAKLRFIKRGGTAVGAINGDDLVERDGDAFESERVQEAELLRRVTVGYNDPQAAYALTTQKWERRAGTVQALGEASVELPLTLDADDAATIAKRRGLVAWGEPEKQKFSLPYRLGKYTPTDIITYTDDDGLVHTIRLMDLQDDSGVRYVESSMNSAEAYGATATGVVPRPPSITEPALRGPTLLAVMDLPIWRSSDSDTLGLYVAGCGYLGGWQGAQVDVSTDGGTSYSEAAQVTIPATIGTTTTALEAWASSEYPSVQSLTVTLPDAPESVSYEALLRYNNRAALQLDDGSWEILQYQTVVANGSDSYTLSGLLRGRYATTPGAASAGARFVLLDAAVQFVPVERHLLGETFKVRATTYGTSSDAVVASDFAFTAGASQTEWPVHGVTASRDGSDNVTVTWIGRARLGVETAPYHSTNFAGYRVTYSDGQSFDVAANVTTHTRSSAPASQTITVRPLNAITGAGPASTGITV